MAAPSPMISPILADLSQDIAGAIPLELILLWNTSDKSGKKHVELLEPYTRKGTVVSTDSAGLSKLSAQRELLDVMQLISQPKEVIYAYGKAIGGTAIGLWVADNSLMFYDEKVQPQDVIEVMIASQQEIKNLTVQVGMGIHHGTFLEIGGGMYGGDADFIEELAENKVEGSTIVVSHSIKKRLAPNFSSKLSLLSGHNNVFLLDYASENPSREKHTESQYPYPFNSDFYEFLRAYESLSEEQRAEKLKSFTKNKVVILVKIQHTKQKHMLEELTSYIVANAYINQTLKEFAAVTTVKSNGNLGIFVADDVTLALDFSKKIREKLDRNDLTSNIGVTSGDILLFPLQNGFEIAGGPVNLASKLAEDGGEVGKIFVEQSVKVDDINAMPFSFKISNVEIRGKYL